MRKLIFAFSIILSFSSIYSKIVHCDDFNSSPLMKLSDKINQDEKANAHNKLANPASVYCSEIGGFLEIKTYPNTGGAYGLCHLPDGRICEEWSLFRDQKCINPENESTS